VLGKTPADVEHARRAQSRLRRDRFIGQAALTQPDHLPPPLLLRCRWELAHIFMFHPSKLGRNATIFKTTQTGSIIGGLPVYELLLDHKYNLVRDMTISGIAFDMLKTVTHVGDTLRWREGAWCSKKQLIPLGIGGPALKCRVMFGGQ
jgi:hypothetical protein